MHEVRRRRAAARACFLLAVPPLASGLADPATAGDTTAPRAELVSTVKIRAVGPLVRHAVRDLELAIDEAGVVHAVWSGKLPDSANGGSRPVDGTFYQRGDTAGVAWSEPRRLVDRILSARILFLGDDIHVLLGPGFHEYTTIHDFVSGDRGSSWRELDPLLSFRWNMVEGFDAIAVEETLFVASVSSRRFIRQNYLDYPRPDGFSVNLLRRTGGSGRDSTHVAWLPESIFSQPDPVLLYNRRRLHLVVGSNRNRREEINWVHLMGDLRYFESEDVGRTWSTGVVIEHPDSFTVDALDLVVQGERRTVLAWMNGLDAYTSTDGRTWTHERVITIRDASTLSPRLAASLANPSGFVAWPAGKGRLHSRIEACAIAVAPGPQDAVLLAEPMPLGTGWASGSSPALARFGGSYFVLWSGIAAGPEAPPASEEIEWLFLSKLRLVESH